MNIGIDLDDVVFDLIGELLRIYNKKYKTNASRSMIQGWDFFPIEIYEEFKKSDGYKRLNLISNSKGFLYWARNIGNLFVVTTRSEEYREDTYRSLKEKLPEVFEQERIHFTPGSKLQVCKDLNIHLLIDDSIVHTKEAAENGIYAILYNNGTAMFEKFEIHPKIYKANNMEETKKCVLIVKSILG